MTIVYKTANDATQKHTSGSQATSTNTADTNASRLSAWEAVQFFTLCGKYAVLYAVSERP